MISGGFLNSGLWEAAGTLIGAHREKAAGAFGRRGPWKSPFMGTPFQTTRRIQKVEPLNPGLQYTPLVEVV